MGNAKFFSYNWLVQDFVEFTYDSDQVDPYFPLENIQLPFSTKVFRTMPGITSFQFVVDLKAFATIDTVLMKGHAINGFGINSVLVEGSGTLDFSTPAVSENVTLNNKHNFGSAFFNSASCRYWRFTVATGGNYVELSNIFLGKFTQLEYNNIDYNWKYKSDDNSNIDANKYGQQYSDKLNRVKFIDAKFNFLTKDEFKTLEEVFEAHGKTIPFWFIVDPEGTIYDEPELFSGQFYFTDIPDITNVAFMLYACDIKLKECV